MSSEARAGQAALPLNGIKPARRLTRKQRRFIAQYIRSGNGSQAALAAGYGNSEGVARSIASENLTKPNIRAAIEIAWESEGITPALWATTLRRKLAATRLISLGIGDVREVEDHSTQLKAVELSARMLGALEPQKATFHAHAHLHRLQGMPAEELEELAAGRKPEGQS